MDVSDIRRKAEMISLLEASIENLDGWRDDKVSEIGIEEDEKLLEELEHERTCLADALEVVEEALKAINSL